MDLFVNFIQSKAEANRSRQNININILNILNSIIQELNNDLEQVVENQGNQEDNYKPATKEFIDSLEEVEIDRDDITCSICLEEFKKGEKCIRLPCQEPHYFHTNNENCLGIKKWLEKSNTCPMCRTEFPCVEAPRLEINVEEIDQRLETVLNGILQRQGAPLPRHIHILNPARFNPGSTWRAQQPPRPPPPRAVVPHLRHRRTPPAPRSCGWQAYRNPPLPEQPAALCRAPY